MKFVTYNVQFSRGRDNKMDLGRIAETVAGADVIALQEVERNWQRSDYRDQPAELAELLPDYYWVYGAAYDLDASFKDDQGRIVNRRRQFGNMLLSRVPILISRNHILPKQRTLREISIQRGALEGVIETASGLVRIYSVHLGHMLAAERMEQIEALQRIHERATVDGWAWTGDDPDRDPEWGQTGKSPEMPATAVFMGDFNLIADSPEYDALVGPSDPDHGRVPVGHRFVDAWGAAGHDEKDGVSLPEDPANGSPYAARIDYCFVTEDLGDRVQSSWIDSTAMGSDHLPVWSEICL